MNRRNILVRPILVTALTISWFLCGSAVASFDELPDATRNVLNDGECAVTVRLTWQEYHDRYAKATSGKPEQADREQKWSTLRAYAEHLWILRRALKAGDLISDYPGILAHGTTRWNSDSKTYELTLGLRPFDAGDGLGQFTVSFNLKGVVSEVRLHKYKW